ncbi:hypothetical protein RI129_009805 [Pyrocoelia pectoralis]|uniref:Uncharacterized protein n=1 Tax=Pyrocoelia pectoralis TaxID=417401 RepID=A0AAN7ZJ93_9COLE
MNILVFVLTVSFNIFLNKALNESHLEEQDYACMKILNLTVEFVLNGFNQFNFLTEGCSELNEFVNCSWHKAGYLNSDSEIDPERVKDWINTNLVQKTPESTVTAENLVNPCKDIKGEDSGDTVVKVYNCMMEIWWQSRW